MGVFFFKLQKGTFKVHSTKKREERPRHPSSTRATKSATIRRQQQQQPRTSRPADGLRYYGWSWPKVVGLTASEAKSRIERDCPGVYCQVVSVNQLLTMCYCSGRVRLLVDRNGTVVKTPRVG
ncbi:hypothetical protein BDA96_03G384900 [Sorghum bicolor]|uniref:Uncharacterized protein n=2 Tax=Sorghum bicolor TaxID=4558 RepID=A0A921UPU6_SORBI|nr:hypothetical protein BDA96_03G384900 [Sorghum bicolor]OQU87859.1 hypothetical protein SORBI_3003G356850 [Sorghum bicolor]